MMTIYEPDPLLRQAIAQALSAHGLAGMAQVAGEPPSTAGAGYTLPAGSRLRIGDLLERVKREAGRRPAGPGLRVGRFILDADDLALKPEGGGAPLRLTEKEHRILEILAASRGETVERRNLLHAVWGYGDNIETHTLETHIYRLRQKIEVNPAAPGVLLTDEQGYRLV